MESRFAHRGRERFERFCAVCGVSLVCVRLTLGVASPALAGCGSPEGFVRVASVNERLDVALEDGRTVRLGGLDVPNADRGALETATAAREFLAAWLIGAQVEIEPVANGADRWGRVVADLAAPKKPGESPASVASALLAAGYARVRPEFETRGCALERLAIEDGARRAGLGIWREREYAVIQSSDAPELRRRDGQFVIVEGAVRRVGFGRSRLYLDLVPPGGPTIIVARKLEAAFAREGRPVAALVSRTIRVRGALDARIGPKIGVDEPAMIEVLRPFDASGETKPRP